MTTYLAIKTSSNADTFIFVVFQPQSWIMWFIRSKLDLQLALYQHRDEKTVTSSGFIIMLTRHFMDSLFFSHAHTCSASSPTHPHTLHPPLTLITPWIWPTSPSTELTILCCRSHAQAHSVWEKKVPIEINTLKHFWLSHGLKWWTDRILGGHFCLRALCFLHKVTEEFSLERNCSAATRHSFPTFFLSRSMQYAKGADLLEMEASDQHHRIFIFHSHLQPLCGSHTLQWENSHIRLYREPVSAGPAITVAGGIIPQRCHNIDRSSQCFIRSICSTRDKSMTREVGQREALGMFEISRQPNVGYYYFCSCLVNWTKFHTRQTFVAGSKMSHGCV